MEQYGESEESIAQVIAMARKADDQRDDGFCVYYDNWHAWELFMLVSNQWVRDGFGVPAALDGNVVLGVLALDGRNKRKQLSLYADVMLIASGVLDVIHKRKAEELEQQKAKMRAAPSPARRPPIRR